MSHFVKFYHTTYEYDKLERHLFLEIVYECKLYFTNKDGYDITWITK